MLIAMDEDDKVIRETARIIDTHAVVLELRDAFHETLDPVLNDLDRRVAKLEAVVTVTVK
jgi:hypothetical protein